MSADDIDLPFEEIPGGPITQDLTNALIASGVVVLSAAIPSPDGTYPALVFRFHLASGTQLPPVVLIATTEQLGNIVPLVTNAADSAIAYARRGGTPS